MYRQGAMYYDVVYASRKNYRAEADAVRGLLAAQRPSARRVLDVGCGSGEHDRFLAEWFEVDGVDLNPELVALARSKRPGADYHVADMTALDLPKSYDAAICLFSAIAYLPTVDRVADALRRMAAHLGPGGVLIVEPWHTPRTWRPERSNRVEDARMDQIEVRRVVRASTAEASAVFRFEYRVRDCGHERSFVETHVLTLFTAAQMREAFGRAGLAVSHVDCPPFPRGLYVASHREAP
jgi:SAM-dependent methyltransferase